MKVSDHVMDDALVDHGDDIDESHEVLRAKANEPCETTVSLRWRVFALIIVTLITIMKSTQEYLLIVTIFGMATELEFGETECQVINKTQARDYLGDRNITGDVLCAVMGRCSENSTLFLPDVCGIRYIGRGTLYDVLAGPIYLVIQGVATIPLIGVVQGFSMRTPSSIAMFTTLWTLCTLCTTFVQDYWAVALLRFLFGVFSGPYTPLSFAYLTRIFPSKDHSTVLGITMYGYIAGYGVSYLFNLFSDSLGWRWCYLLCGSVGLVLAIASCFMASPEGTHSQEEIKTFVSWSQHRASLSQITWSCMMCVILSNTARLASGYVISYNLTFYLAEYFPEFNVTVIGLITLVAGFLGSVFGGWLGDRLRKITRIRGRIGLCLILEISGLVIAMWMFQSPLTALVILFSIIVIVGEWFSVTMLSVISDLTPYDCKVVVFAINFFFTHSIVGSVNLAVTPITSLTNLRAALMILCGVLASTCIALLLPPVVCLHIPDIKLRQERDKNIDMDKNKEEVNEQTPLNISYDGSDKSYGVYEPSDEF